MKYHLLKVYVEERHFCCGFCLFDIIIGGFGVCFALNFCRSLKMELLFPIFFFEFMLHLPLSSKARNPDFAYIASF